jgi:hypothetical protein
MGTAAPTLRCAAADAEFPSGIGNRQSLKIAELNDESVLIRKFAQHLLNRVEGGTIAGWQSFLGSNG